MRKRRVRLFELALTLLSVATLLFGAFLWSDLSVNPRVALSYTQFPSTDGVTISGVLFRPQDAQGALPGVVVVHGLTAYKETMHRLSVEVARHGFVVLAIDLRDHGMSNGQCTLGLPAAEPQDVVSAVEFLRATPGVDPDRMAIVGHSFGGMVALTAASMPGGQVNATVVWAPPVNLTSLDRDNHAAIAFVADKRVLPLNITDPTELALRSPIQYLASVRSDSLLFLHGEADVLIPVNQSEEGARAAASRGARITTYPGVGHAMDTLQVVDDTISFLESKTKGQSQPPLDPAYPAFERDRAAVYLCLALLNLPLAWLSWEFFCTRDREPVRLYTFPSDRRRLAALPFAAADIAAFAAVAVAAGSMHAPGSQAPLFQGTIPAPGLFSALVAAGLALALACPGLVLAERHVRGRDDARFEEGEGAARSLATVAAPLAVALVLTPALELLLFMGSNTPRSAGFALALAVLFLFALGFEAFLRLRIQRRLRDAVTALVGTGGLTAAVGNILVGSLLYLAMLSFVLALVFRGYIGDSVGTAAALTVGVGVLSSLLFDRTKNVLPGALFTGAYLAWALNASFHF